MTPAATSVPGLLARHASERPKDVALRSKRHGLWGTMTYAEVAVRAGALAAGLRELGVAPGSPVALVAENSPEWIIADLAVQALGASSIALPPQTAPEAAVRVLADTGATVIICGDQEQVDLVLDAGQDLPAVRAMVVIDPTGTGRYDDPRLRTLADVEAAATGDPVKLDADPSAQSVVMFSAGSAGDPRPTAHTSGTTAAIAVNDAEWSELSPQDRNLTVLSLALPAARVLDVYAPLTAGSQITLPEAPATILADLRDVAPSVLTLSPRAAELLRQSSVRRGRESAGLRRAAYDWGMRKLDERLDKSESARTLAGARRGRGLPYLLVGRWVAADLGLHRARRIVVAGGALPARVSRFFWSLGIPVLETYGQAELGGVAIAQSSLDDAGTVGRPLPGVQVKVSDSGELAVTTPGAGAGGEPVWHETGDVAEDAGDGRFRVRGRRADVVRTPQGDVVADELETALCESAYIRRAVVTVVGEAQLTALVEVDFDETAPWAAAKDIYFSTYGSLVTRPEVGELIAGEVAAANDRLGGSGAIADFVVLPRELSVRDGELTSSLVIRRSQVVEHFDTAVRAERMPAASRVGAPDSV